MPERKSCDRAEWKGMVNTTIENNICLYRIFMTFGLMIWHRVNYEMIMLYPYPGGGVKIKMILSIMIDLAKS
jgi:hypothetical protein